MMSESIKHTMYDVGINKTYAAKSGPVHDRRECFANAAALAILNVKGFGTHFPTQLSKDISANFARRFRELYESVLKKDGVYTELLPPPNLMWQVSLNWCGEKKNESDSIGRLPPL